MSVVTLPALSPVVKIPNGDQAVTYREVAGHPSYAVGDDGSAWKLGPYNARVKKWRRMNPSVISSGYKLIGIYLGRRVRVGKLVHRLILEAFRGPCPEGMEACHNNGVKLDNRLENLRWDDHANNIADQIEHGTRARGERHGNAVLTENEVKEIRVRRASGEPQKRVAKMFGVSEGTIEQIVGGKVWGWLA